MIVRETLPEAQREAAAALFWEAFEGKLGPALGPREKALTWIERAIHPRYAVCALGGGRLLGVAGYKTRSGGLIGGGFADLARVYGMGALWRGLALSLFERPVEPGVLLMDGIFVAEGARGLGVGTRLLSAVEQVARREGARAVRLDVVDGNRARGLYERRGFREVARTRTGWAAPLMGFEGASVMELPLT